MSDSSDSENDRRSSAAVVNRGQDAGSSRSVISESTNSSDNHQESNSSSDNNEDGVIVNRDNMGGGESDEVVVSEDARREDMFLDASEDLGTDGGESTGFNEGRGSSDNDEQQSRFRGLDNEMQNDYMVDEVERLRFMLDKTVNEKESMAQKYKDEIEMASKAIADLRGRMSQLINRQLSVEENSSWSYDHFHLTEIRDEENKVYASDTSLHEMIHECSMFLRSAMAERTRAEGVVQELQASHDLKDREIEDLNRNIAELSVSSDVVSTYLNSVQKVSLEAQLQSDWSMDDVANRILGSLASVVYVEELPDNSVTRKIAQVEKCMCALIENFKWFLYETDQLRQKLAEFQPDFAEQNDYGVIYAAAGSKLLEFRRKEVDFAEKLSNMEKENGKLVAELDKYKAVTEAAHSELERIKAELDQEKSRYSNTKEKLSLAVTKGKALVQQRDSLKQSLANKTGELDKCLTMLQEKSCAVEAAESIKEVLVKNQISAALLQEMLTQRDTMLEKIEEILSQNGVPGGLKMDVTEKTSWLVDERNALKDVSQKFHKFADVLLSIDLPESFSFSDLDSRLSWLTESFDHAKSEISVLQAGISRTKESAYSEMERLTSLLSAVLVEKDYLKMELDDMIQRFDVVIEKEHQVSSENEWVLRKLVEASGVPMGNQEGISDSFSGTARLVEQCLRKIKEQSSSAFESSQNKTEILESMQIRLYIRDQGLVLCEQLLEEELFEKSELNKLLNDFRKASEEVGMLKEERDSLKREFERVEEKSAVLREKLSMAVKKGKGLVQDRENLKQLIDEKSAEIEKLTIELQQQESVTIECRSQNSRLSAELECIPKLEADLVAMKDERDQLEMDLVESNKILGKVKVEAEALASKLSEAHSVIKLLEDELSVAQNRISLLVEEKEDLEASKASIEEQLRVAVQESRSMDSMFAEATAAKISFENALSWAETNISLLEKEKEESHFSRVAAEEELVKVKEEVTALTRQVADASTTIKSLEDVVSQFETRTASLTEENINAQIGRSQVDSELKKLKEEANKWDAKLQEAFSTIRSLEESLAKAENSLFSLSNENKAAEQNILTLNTKLNACMEELNGTRGSLQTRSVELFVVLKDLELLVKDESIFSLLRRGCEEKLESLKEMDLLFKNIRGLFAETSLENHPVVKEVFNIEKFVSMDLVTIVNTEPDSSSVDMTEADDMSLHVQKIAESFYLKQKTLAEKFDKFSCFVNKYNAAVVEELQATKDNIIRIVEYSSSLKERVKNVETHNQTLENAIATLVDDISVLRSACTDATVELQRETDKHLIELGSFSEKETETQPKVDRNKHAETAEKLLSATRNSAKCRNTLASTIEELQNKLNETKVATEKAMEERNLNQNRVSELETELEVLRNLCSKMRLELEEYQAIEVKLDNRESEVATLHSMLAMHEQEAREALLWASQVKNLLDQVNRIEITSAESQVGELTPQDTTHIKKLQYIIDDLTELQHQVTLLSHEKEELQSALASQLDELLYLKKQVEKNASNEEELMKAKTQLFDLIGGLERIMQKLGGRDLFGHQESVAIDELVEALEKLVTAMIVESENSKSKVHELDSKLLGSQKVVDVLSSKIKVLEDSLQTTVPPPETILERSVFEEPSLPPASEISEVEDRGSIAKPGISPISFAAHARTMRKGSSDHIVNIDSEHFINNEETDEDKGHVFKSLNTSGLIPIQGKMIADRIDGIWVSGARVLMSHPRARLGVIAYWLLLHLWWSPIFASEEDEKMKAKHPDSSLSMEPITSNHCWKKSHSHFFTTRLGNAAFMGGNSFGFNDAAKILSTRLPTRLEKTFAGQKSVKKLKRVEENQKNLISQSNASALNDHDGLKSHSPSEVDSDRENFSFVNNDDVKDSITIPLRSSVLQACFATSGLIAALGLVIRQVSHAASSEGLPILDCSELVSFYIETWHLELIGGLVISVSLSRYLLLKTWPDFSESSEAANRQVLTSLQPFDYMIVAFLPGISEELLFRGALLPLFGLNWKSAMVVAAVFGGLHLGNGRKYSFAIWATLVGLAYGYATVLSSSVVVPMASHALNNLVGAFLWRYTSRSSKVN
ncbi:hypothetical protein Nepgr_032936 [Nepenthes gracilis]|uniref:CAAX prenyl protease 2/Lysostaphin resistance protein A-like domain-containing protein n=1 Tax=Nepenthes gracilis TaxID=150966 RepID=A0AAD3Y6H4_NEPGR|nr:hypothetical protein Nepgr_032936 [Nepenthes gracilis]